MSFCRAFLGEVFASLMSNNPSLVITVRSWGGRRGGAVLLGMRQHDQQRFAKLVSEFIDGCGIAPPPYSKASKEPRAE